ncbi:hypothetical protein LRR81_09745 [Metabacillus sp. GX 13764]|uniref:hypothetical protein n=1 Tax=Metabacillus kandeliae TaxID=2900151 RepID=UPI001E462D90|nr:hypothetical protein [Metabacillus kandeliae]MCD7034521.1 hypothetical protein [Metabacillus kandeliae]
MDKRISYGALVIVFPLSILSILFKTSIYLVLLILAMAIYYLIVSFTMFRYSNNKPLAVMIGFIAIAMMVMDYMLYSLVTQMN